MKTKSIKPSLILKIGAIVLLILIGVALLFEGTYYFKRQFLLYDAIEFEGTWYYMTEEHPDGSYNSERVQVHLVDGGKVYHYKTEYAYTYKSDSENKFLYFNSATYTSDRSIVIPPYRVG